MKTQEFVEKSKDIVLYLERFQPMLAHLQISEALTSVLGDNFIKKIQEFDIQKLNELNMFHREVCGVEPDL